MRQENGKGEVARKVVKDVQHCNHVGSLKEWINVAEPLDFSDSDYLSEAAIAQPFEHHAFLEHPLLVFLLRRTGLFSVNHNFLSLNLLQKWNNGI